MMSGLLCNTGKRNQPSQCPFGLYCNKAHERSRKLVLQEQLMELCLFRLKKRMLRRNLIALYNSMTGSWSEVWDGLFCHNYSERTRRNGLKLRQGRSRLGFRNIFSLLAWSGIGIGHPGRWWSHHVHDVNWCWVMWSRGYSGSAG